MHPCTKRPARIPLLFGVLLLALSFVFAAGCGGSGGTGSGEGWLDRAKQAAPREEAGEEGAPEGSGAISAGKDTIHMCGRSVLGDWFRYWGWDFDPANPVRFRGYRLVYHEMDGPPGIVDTAAEVARAVGDAGGGTMFFKLCFADFAGGDEYAARENLEANEDMVRRVVEVAVDGEGLALIIGNALPMVEECSDEWLVWNHREYNRFLERLAAAYGGRVAVLDLYGTLAAADGQLRPEYASDPSDSHLNAAAYAALDEAFGDLLSE